MARLLLVEDDRTLARAVARGMREEDFQVETLGDGEAAMKRLLAGGDDVCILDAGLPLLDGFKVVAAARAAGVGVPILILTARDTTADRVEGLDLGADDYLVKPFEFAELLARVRALLRRGPGRSSGTLTAEEVKLDPHSRKVWRAGKLVDLTTRQFDLLEYLLRHRGQIVRREELVKALWGYDFNTHTNLVDVQVASLRSRLDRPGRPSLIRTVRGVGYGV